MENNGVGEVKLRGTENGYVTFLKSTIWKDIQHELDVWRAMAESDYQTAENMQEVTKIQGRVEAIDYMLQLPNMLLDGIRDANTEKEEREV